MHETIADRVVPWSEWRPEALPAHGLIASAVYGTIRGINGLLREGADQLLNLWHDTPATIDHSRQEIPTLAALNGVFGDHLEATGNPLAIPMSFRTGGRRLDINADSVTAALPNASPNIVVLVHGLSLSELCWQRNGAVCIGTKLQDALGYTPLYLRYNTGRHISTNGQEFAQRLQDLCEAWPVPVESLCLIGHSMGGLVIRSACWYAQRNGNSWLGDLQRVVCLGTPHHGSPLEKAGYSLDMAMQRIPYLAPLAFGKHRSAGIKDLRHGDLLDEDWQNTDTKESSPRRRRAVALMPGVEYYFAAATLGADMQDRRGRVLGDLLVRMDSAVGSHKDDLRKLHIKPANCRVFHEKNHFDLLDDERVQQQIIDWFS
jgi:pimeloyl-ACP methyl ester carboxylesterase